jgi:hypothetical protein
MPEASPAVAGDYFYPQRAIFFHLSRMGPAKLLLAEESIVPEYC